MFAIILVAVDINANKEMADNRWFMSMELQMWEHFLVNEMIMIAFDLDLMELSVLTNYQFMIKEMTYYWW
jgi:hypothetical protein